MIDPEEYDRLKEYYDFQRKKEYNREQLQTAIDEDGVNAKRPEAEKRLSRARRAVDKAAAIIGQTPESTTL